MTDLNVLICGGGIAGIEGLLRLRRLAAERVELTLVSPQEEFVCRPLAVREPFALGGVRRYPLERIASDTGASWIRDRLAQIDVDARTVRTGGGRELAYDAILLAVGARESASYEHAQLFTDRDPNRGFQRIVQDIERGKVSSVAFVLPDGPTWPLPLYELALMTAEHARNSNRDARITFITPEGRPLKAFGTAAGDAIVGLLGEAGIKLHSGVVARVPGPHLVTFGDTRLEADRIVTLPRITGPAVAGLAAGTDWFAPIDDRCVVGETGGRVFAAGDATDFPVKHGGISAQQADTAAAGIAHLAGCGQRPPPFAPVIRAMLLTGDRPLYLTAHVVAGLGWRSKIYKQPPWLPDEKVIAEELGPYLADLDLTTRRLRPPDEPPALTGSADTEAGWRVARTAGDQAGRALGGRLIAVYAIGSLAHGGFSPAVSDIDVAVLVDHCDASLPDTVSAIVTATQRELGPGLADRLSIFYGDWSSFAAPRFSARMGAIDRLDILEHGVLMQGVDRRAADGSRPTRDELVAETAELLKYQQSLPRDPDDLIAAGPRPLTKAVLFPVRFLYTHATGNAGANADAVYWYRDQGGPHAELALAALAWRSGNVEAGSARRLLEDHLEGLYDECRKAFGM